MRVVLKSSLKNICRNLGRTSLFTGLIAVLTAFLSLCVMLLCHSRERLAALNEEYTTLGVVEYYGDSFPDVWAYDQTRSAALAEFDHSLISQEQSVLSYAPCRDSVAAAEGYLRRAGTAPCRNQAILIVKDLYYVDSHKIHIGLSVNALYSFRSNTDLSLLVELGDSGFVPEPDAVYALHGQFVEGATALPCLLVEALPESVTGGRYIQPWVKIEGSVEDFLLDPPEEFSQAARLYSQMNSAVSVYAMDESERFLPLHQQRMEFTGGRAFTQEEIDGGEAVCIASDAVLAVSGKRLSDKLTLEYLDYDNGQCYGTVDRREYTVVGSVHSGDADQGYVCVPSRSIPENAAHLGYTLGTAVVDNNRAPAFYENLAASLPRRFGVSVYDQGYAQTAAGAKSLQRTAAYLTAVCGVSCAGVLLLYGFIFVYRQRESVGVMQSLGTGRGKTLAYLVFGALLVALIAAAIGACIGAALSQWVGQIAQANMQAQPEPEVGYGISSIGVMQPDTLTYTVSFAPALAACALIPVLGAVCCLGFGCKALRRYQVNRSPKRPRPARVRKGRSSSLPGGPWKFAILSTLRSGWRSLAVPLVTLVLLVFLGALTSSLSLSRLELANLAEQTPVDGYFADSTGRRASGLSITAENVDKLTEFSGVTQTNASYSIKYKYLGSPRGADGTETLVPDMELPDMTTIGGQMRMETLRDRLPAQSDVFFTNDIYTVPEFFYSGAMRPSFMEGYDSSVFRMTAEEFQAFTTALPCIVPETLLQQHGLHLGDTIRLAMGEYFTSQDFYIIGSFPRCADKDNIYAPIEPQRRNTPMPSYVSASFSLKNAAQLDNFYQFLDQRGYGSPGRLGANRATVIVKDMTYLSGKDRLEKQIGYLETLLPILFMMVCVLGLVISYLMMAGRRPELDMMRSLGAAPPVIFLSFFLEFVMMGAAGCIAALLWWCVSGGLTRPVLLCAGVYLICYASGCALSILRMCRGSLMNHSFTE